MHIVKDDAMSIRCCWSIVEDVSKDDACLGRRHLDRRLDALEAMWTERILYWPLDELQIAQGRKFDRQVLQRL